MTYDQEVTRKRTIAAAVGARFRPAHGFRGTFRDGVDRLCLRGIGRQDLPPHSLRCHVGPLAEYEQVPSEYIGYLKLLCGYGSEHVVLDIGCGTGRFAERLFGHPTFATGKYAGFDVDERAIRWARENVSARHPKATFERVDLFNAHYNPTGTERAETFRFPGADASFDIALAMSVFTHLPAAVAANYLREIGRVLRPGGRALLSFVLLDEEVDRLGPLAHERLHTGVMVRNGLDVDNSTGRVHRLDGYATLTPSTPEIVTFHDEAAVTAMAREGGLVVDAVYPGTWRDEAGLAFQDVVVVSRS